MKKFIKIFLLFFVPLMFAISMGTWFFVNLNIESSKTIIQKTEEYVVESQRELIKRYFGFIISDLEILAGTHVLREILDKETDNKNELNEEYLLFSKEKRFYDQIRYLDSTGMEIVRVNFNDGNPIIVAKGSLQNKGKRYYFSDAFALEKGKIFVSPLDLNIEKGIIERPNKANIKPKETDFNNTWILAKDNKYVKPMIRFAKPVFNSQNEKEGVVLINFLAARLLNLFDERAKNSTGKCFLINKDGFFLTGADIQETWGFMQEHDEQQTCKNIFPEIWEIISKKESGQESISKGLITFTTAYPIEANLITSTGAGDAFLPSLGAEGGEEYSWKIVSFVPKGVFNLRSKGFLQSVRIGYSLLLILFFIISCLGARTVIAKEETKKQERKFLLEIAENEKRKANEIEEINKKLKESNENLKKSNIAIEKSSQELQEKMATIEKFNKIAIGREKKMLELKQRINDLSVELGREAPFA